MTYYGYAGERNRERGKYNLILEASTMFKDREICTMLEYKNIILYGKEYSHHILKCIMFRDVLGKSGKGRRNPLQVIF